MGHVVQLRQHLVKVLDALEMRPWLPAAMFGISVAGVALVPLARLANVLESQWRILPHFSDEFSLFLGKVADVLFCGAFAVWVIAMLLPLVLLIARRFKTAFFVFALNLAATLSVVWVVILMGPLLFCFALEQDELQHAEKERVRASDVSSRYDFGPGGRYVFVDRIGEESFCYDLYDTRTRQLLVEQVVKWDEKGGKLIFSTKAGKRCALSYDQGLISEMAREK